LVCRTRRLHLHQLRLPLPPPLGEQPERLESLLAPHLVLPRLTQRLDDLDRLGLAATLAATIAATLAATSPRLCAACLERPQPAWLVWLVWLVWLALLALLAVPCFKDDAQRDDGLDARRVVAGSQEGTLDQLSPRLLPLQGASGDPLVGAPTPSARHARRGARALEVLEGEQAQVRLPRSLATPRRGRAPHLGQRALAPPVRELEVRTSLAEGIAQADVLSRRLLHTRRGRGPGK
jgi:hypothetical protein